VFSATIAKLLGQRWILACDRERRGRFPQHHCREDRDERGESNNGFVYNRH